MPFFSVIIPVYNREALIVAALESVLAQSFADYELIVVDDGSADATTNVIQRYIQRHAEKVFLLRQSNAGPGAARNTGIARATGKYITFLDSDDLWFPWTLECHARAIKEFDSPCLISGNSTALDTIKDVSTFEPRPWKARSYPNLFSVGGNTLAVGGTPSVAIKAECLQQAGGFPTAFINAEDQDLWLRLGCAEKFVHIESPPLFANRHHPGRISINPQRSIDGARYLAAREHAGQYPGGRQFRTIRREIVTSMLRETSIGCLEHRRFEDAWWMYRKAWLWNARLGRWRYLLGFPFLALLKTIRPDYADIRGIYRRGKAP